MESRQRLSPALAGPMLSWPSHNAMTLMSTPACNRCVAVAWRLYRWVHKRHTDASFCVDCLEDALREHGRPRVFNSDQGSQFTSYVFTGVLKREGIAISMDGRGRALDNIFVERLWRNVKHEDVYLKGYANMAELMIGLAQYFYNEERPHQSLGYKTPDAVYASGEGGGAMIVDKFGGARGFSPRTIRAALFRCM